MITVKVTLGTGTSERAHFRQTSNWSGIWGNCQFWLNASILDCDWWVVLDDLPQPETAICPLGCTIFVNGEPPTVKTYDERFLRQFGTVVACQDTRHPKVLRTQQSLFWQHQFMPRVEEEDALPPSVAYQDYDRLCRHEPLIKTETISAIASDKTFTAGHRERLAFAQRLKERMGDHLHLFGRGIAGFSDK